MTTVHDWNRAEDIGPRIIAAFYAGKSVRDIGLAFEKSEGVVSGVLTRGRVVRSLWPGKEAFNFLADESYAFAVSVRAGRSPERAAQALGKDPKAGVKHAKALGLLEKRKVSQVNREAALAAKALSPPKVVVNPVEASPRHPDDSAEDKAQRDRDDRYVALLIGEGGFNRYDDGFDWLLNMHGARIAAVSDGAKAELMASRTRLGAAA
jgi:hypothetical protein